VLGALVALSIKAPVVAAMALVGLFAIFHGHAHGAEMPEDAGGLAYAAGFMLAAALLHVAGIAMGFAIGQASNRIGPAVLRIGGGAAALAAMEVLLFRSLSP
jgi:urease accessory protein